LLVDEAARAPPPPPPPPIKLIALLALFQSPGVVKLVPEVKRYAFKVDAAKSIPRLLLALVELTPEYHLYESVPFVANGVNDKSITLR
jgi:hypothetical protein